MGPDGLNDLPKVTQLVPDFVLITLPSKQPQTPFTTSTSAQGLGFSVSVRCVQRSQP